MERENPTVKLHISEVEVNGQQQSKVPRKFWLLHRKTQPPKIRIMQIKASQNSKSTWSTVIPTKSQRKILDFPLSLLTCELICLALNLYEPIQGE